MPNVSDDDRTLKNVVVSWWGTVEDEADRIRLKMPIGLSKAELSRLEGQTSYLAGELANRYHVDPAPVMEAQEAIHNRTAGIDRIERQCLALMTVILRSIEDRTTGNRADSADNGKINGVVHPENVDVADLCKELANQCGKGKSEAAIARDFCKGSDLDPKNLLRQARRFQHLWKR